MITAEELNGLYQTELAALAQDPVNGKPSAVSMRQLPSRPDTFATSYTSTDAPTLIITTSSTPFFRRHSCVSEGRVRRFRPARALP